MLTQDDRLTPRTGATMLHNDGRHYFHPDKLPFETLPWWRLRWTRLWCQWDGHGGLTYPPGPRAASYSHGLCKRCGLLVKL